MTQTSSLKELIAETARSPGTHIPVFNPVALEVQKLAHDDKVSLARIEATLLRDPVLSAQVLRMANSSRYGGLSTAATLKQALSRLGAEQVVRLAMAAAQVSLYQSRHPLFRSSVADLWKTAFASAIGAAWIAHRSNHGEIAEQAFLAGLMHDVGKLVVMRSIEKLMFEQKIEAALPDAVAMEMVDALHCEFGFELTRRWNLPEAYAVICRDHHLEACDTGNVLLVAVRLIDEVCRKMGIGCAPEPGLMPAAGEEAAALMLNEVALADLEVTLEDKLGLRVVAAA